MRRNGRRYGGYVVHIGVLLIALGIIGNEFYQSEGQANLKRGESVRGQLHAHLQPPRHGGGTELYGVYRAADDLAQNGKPHGQILPTKNIYDKNPEQPMTEVGLRPGPIEDVYVVLAGFESGARPRRSRSTSTR